MKIISGWESPKQAELYGKLRTTVLDIFLNTEKNMLAVLTITYVMKERIGI